MMILFGSGTTTFTVIEALFPRADAVITAVPTATGVTLPVWSTVATFSLSVDQLKVNSRAGVTTGTSVKVVPSATLTDSLSKDISASYSITFILIEALAFLSFTVTVMLTSPIAMPVIFPV